jgi:UDP-N-acetylglucosamine 4,6-dehydratase/5-epimerase
MNKNNLDQKLKKELKNKVILVTGGAGSIGSGLVEELLRYPVKSVRVLDNNENGLFHLKRLHNESRLRLFLGNVEDYSRVEIAGNDVDIIFHLAAAKNIEITEYNPIETINTNITGIINLIRMAIKNKPQKFINISTDKAANPTTLYGSTKQISEYLTSWATAEKTKFATIRFGNVQETRGNVFEIWNEQAKNNKPLTITNPKMERFFIKKHDAVNWILKCFLLAKDGEIFVPKLKSFKILDLAKSISKKHKIIGLRYGEKISETLITEQEKRISKETKEMWIIKQHTRD